MMEGARLLEVRWELDEDGGGTAWLLLDFDGVELHQQRVIFESLDSLGTVISTAIRDDGGTEGSFMLPPLPD